MGEPNRTVPASQPPDAAAPPAVAPDVDAKMEPVPRDDAVPKYKVTEACYIGDKHLVTGSEIFWNKKPEHYMHPVNAAARNEVRKHNPKWKDPFGTLPVAPDANPIT